MVLSLMLVLLLTAVPSDELSSATSVSLIHGDIPLVTSSIPLKRDSLLIWGVSPCSLTGGEQQLFKSDNVSTLSSPAVLSGSNWCRSNSCWMGQKSSHSPLANRSGEHLWSKARAAKDDGRFWCWLVWTRLWLPYLVEGKDSPDVESWLVVLCWLFLTRWQPPVRASTCRRI